ncbi:MAG: GNAT family N-acetyltransferase [Spirochaetota bacterium]
MHKYLYTIRLDHANPESWERWMLRTVTPGDYEDCCAIVDRVWRFTSHFKPAQLAACFLDVYTLGSLAHSNFAAVLEEEHTVRGFLFGTRLHGKPVKTRFSGLLGGLTAFAELMLIRNVSVAQKFSIIAMINTHERNRLQAEAQRKYEVNLFAVDPACQGKGYGKILMNSYLDACRNDGIDSVTLDTDEDSNFRFYEHLGFFRSAEYYSPVQEMYSGTNGTSYVYKKDLSRDEHSSFSHE